MNKGLYKFNLLFISALFIFTYICVLWVNKNIIFDVQFYYRSLQSKFSIDSIDNIVLSNKKMDLLAYCLMPFILCIKWFLVSLVLYIGTKLFDIDLYFNSCYRLVVVAEVIPVSILISKTLFLYIYPPENIEYVQEINPLGLINLFKKDTFPEYLIYAIHQINLFEFAYCILLAFGIKILSDITLKKSLAITVISYGFGLSIWCIFIVFLQLQTS